MIDSLGQALANEEACWGRRRETPVLFKGFKKDLKAGLDFGWTCWWLWMKGDAGAAADSASGRTDGPS
jgi:hypothetical protein